MGLFKDDEARGPGGEKLFAVITMVNQSHVSVSIREKLTVSMGEMLMTYDQFRDFYRKSVPSEVFEWRSLWLVDNILRYGDGVLAPLSKLQPSSVDDMQRNGLPLRLHARVNGDPDGVWAQQ